MATTIAVPKPTDGAADTADESTTATRGPAPIVLDFGKHRRKAIKRLRRGEGRLMDDVNSALEELRVAGALSENAQPVIVVVRQRRRRSNKLFPSF
jgi:hypothetical protein